jgi:quinohemoprotein amine dehydrogenase
VIEREGRSIVYTGHQWRGRSSMLGTGPDSAWREVLSVEPGWQELTGRVFRGGYDEFGMDVTLRRAGGGPTIAGVSPRALRPARGEQTVTIYGANLPAAGVGDVSFGPGVTVRGVTRSSPEELVARLTIDSAASNGARDLFVAGAAQRSAVVVYSRVDRIRVAPQAGMARVGGVRFPKQFARFEAIGYLNGADAKPETDDDIEIGPLHVTWGLEEYGVTFKDDDLSYVGAIDSTGLFTPSVDGPNPERRGSRNNIGDVWVVATYRPDASPARPLRARAHLVVTVPLYMRWEPARTAP